ncbi:MAG: cation-translocating P-type ATPase [Opitutales bacterium]|nr:cation-translocating P-type ATPase [Opitutales bacterium]
MSCPNCEKIKAAAARGNVCCAAEQRKARRQEIFVLLFSLASLIAGFAIAQSELHIPGFPLTDPSWIAVALCGFPIFKAAWKALSRDKKITSSLLISIAILASVALQFFVLSGGNSDHSHAHDSYIFAAGEIAFLMALGEAIEMWTVKKSRKGIEALMNLAPKLARRKTANGDTETVPVEELRKGDVIFVRPDDMIPADGTVLEGESSVNQASLTGESIPVDKIPGDTVLAGTRNRSGALTVRVTKQNADNTISRLIRLVREAESKKAPIQHVADRWASRIVPAAILCSVLVALFAYFVLDTNFLTALIRGVTILVVFCPCAFALATPTAVAAGIGNASRHGILVKSGEALEKLTRIDTVVFDKTGTLTRAELKIEATFSSGRLSEKELLAFCAAAELRSQHPIARAIVAAANGIFLPTARNISAKNGIGIRCDIDEEEIFVCSLSALEKEKISVSDAAKNFAETRKNLGETLVCLVSDGVLEGIFALSDTLRERAKETVATLKKRGFSTLMLTGDNAAAAQNFGKLSGVNEVFAELLPEHKAEKINALRGNGKNVLMVGDGVNDAPALASANCSVAMGALGSELAVDTAEIAILNDKLETIPGLLNFSKSVLKTIHINFGISLVINFSSVILSAAGVLDPVTGAIVHNASSVLVVSHSALLMFRKKDFSD